MKQRAIELRVVEHFAIRKQFFRAKRHRRAQPISADKMTKTEV